MIISTTPSLQGQKIDEYCGIVVGEAVMGANIFKDLFASIRDIVGGRSGSYEEELTRARKLAFNEIEHEARSMGANAVVGIDLDYQVIGDKGSMLMVSISGTAVKTLGMYIGFIKWPALHWAIVNVIIYHISWCFFCKEL